MIVQAMRPPTGIDLDRQLTVAINTQVNPHRAGGVESALVRLVETLHERPGDEQYLLISRDEYASDVGELAGPNQRVLSWPFQQTGFPGARKRGRLWKLATRLAGPFGRYVDGVHRRLWEYRRVRPGNATASAADPLLRYHGAQVVHFPYSLPFGTTLPFVYEPWDLQHRHFPEFFNPAEVTWRDRVYGAACQQAAYVAVATRWTKQDIVTQFGIDPARIAVIPRGPGVGARPADAATIERVREQHELPSWFAFFPAMTFPHKNHLRLFEALALLRDRHGVVVPLVCTGRLYKPHWSELNNAVDRLGLRGQVQIFGQVPEEELQAIFALARYMVFPSLFEGLGLPVLEAQQLRVPVLASSATCLPEVGGEGALYFDALDPESIAAAMLRVYERPEILPSLIARGSANLERFSWHEAAATFAACYRSAAGLPLDARQAALLHTATT
ncbi:MAG: glycosyltransferase family 4 protein [Chloroflexi bacterium]|nr:glycosyltransferase family 4 protein [Chloroflexota bacterium]